MLSCTSMTMAMFRQRMGELAGGAVELGGGGSRRAGMPTEHWLRYRGLEAETAKVLCGLPQLDAGQLSWIRR